MPGSCQRPCSLAYASTSATWLRAAAGQPQVGERLRVDREDRAGGAELRAHVADRGPVRERHGGHAVAVELDELADHAVPAQQLGDGQNEIGGGGASGHLPGQPEPDDLRDQHGHGLAQHGRLGLDAAHAPAQDAEAVLHGGVRVGADAGVRVGGECAVLARVATAAARAACHDHPGQVLDVDLVHDPGTRRHHLELAQRVLAPAQELEPLAIAVKLQLNVALEGVSPAEHVGDDRVVDDEFSGHERVDLAGIAAERLHGLPHRGQVNDGGHAGQVLHDHPRRAELDLDARLGRRIPLREGRHVIAADVYPVLVAQQVLQQDLQAERKIGAPLARRRAGVSRSWPRLPAAWRGCQSY